MARCSWRWPALEARGESNIENASGHSAIRTPHSAMPPLVPVAGLEPARLTASDFKSLVSTIPPHGRGGDSGCPRSAGWRARVATELRRYWPAGARLMKYAPADAPSRVAQEPTSASRTFVSTRVSFTKSHDAHRAMAQSPAWSSSFGFSSSIHRSFGRATIRSRVAPITFQPN